MSGRLNLAGRRRVATILQAEAMECGLACLAMICGYHGRHEDLIALRHRFGSVSRGLHLNALIRCAADLSLASRPLRCDLDEVSRLSLPAILHWDFNHFVVLESVSKRGILIQDPGAGERFVTFKEAGNHFTGIALELTPTENFCSVAPRKYPGLLSWFSGIDSLAPALIQILLLSALLQIVALATPFYMQLVVDEVLAKHDVDLLALIALGFLALTLFSVIARAIRGWAGLYLSNQLSYFMGIRLYRHLLSLPTDYFQHRHMGDLVSRFASLKPIQEFLTNTTITVLLDGVMAVTTFAMMVLYAPTLACVALASILIYLGVQLGLYAPVKRRRHESIAADANADSRFMESLRTIGPVKRFGVEAVSAGEWQNRFSDAINARVRVGRLSLALEVVDATISGITNILLIYLGAQQVLSGNMSIGMFYAFLAYRTHMTTSVTSLVNQFMQYLMLSLHLERLADIQLATPEPIQAGPVRHLAGALTIRGVSFRYSESEPMIIENLDLQLLAGQSLAIFGPSGCGKSTLLKAMQGLMPIAGGDILFDGTPLETFGRASLRAGSASVMQGDELLSGSLLENIAFGDVHPDFGRIQSAAAAALIHEEIMQMPMAYESIVGEMGAALSAGQVQRILIARALYRDPKLLFLDEGTAHLDGDSEREVMQNILSDDRTCVFVTHNKRLLAMADQVLLMAPGRHAVKQVRSTTCE